MLSQKQGQSHLYKEKRNIRSIFVIKFRCHALPHSPCDTSRQRLSLFLLLLLILLLRYALSSTRISSTKLDVVLSSSSSSVSEELQTSITAKLSSNSPPSISPAVLLILLCCVTPLVCVASFCWPVCVQENSIHKPRQIGAYSCVYASRTKKPVGDHIIPQSIGHLSSCGPPFTWPRSTTICTVGLGLGNASCNF